MHYKVLGYKKKSPLSESSGKKKKQQRIFLWSFLSVGKNYASEKITPTHWVRLKDL